MEKSDSIPASSDGQARNAARGAFRIAGLYAVFALLWIVLSDRAASSIAGRFSNETTFQTLKGSFFVIFTATMLWMMIRRHLIKQAEAGRVVAESEARHRQTLEIAPFAILLLDDGKVRYRNALAQSLFGDFATEGAAFVDAFGGDAKGQVEDLLSRAHACRGVEALPEVEMPLADKVSAFLELRATRLGADSGEMLIAADDITERKRLEAIVRDTQRMEAAGSVAEQVNHEFNNVLTAILGLTAMARSVMREEPEAIRALNRIESVGQHAAGLTRSLLSLQRPSPSDKKVCDIHEVVGAAHSLIAAVLPQSVAFVVDTDSVRGYGVVCDAGQIKQALLNTAIFARDSMPLGGTLTLTARIDESRSTAGSEAVTTLTLRLRDTGTGVSPRELENVFSTFARGRIDGRGSGLGLAVAKGILIEHGGSVGAAALPGGGSEFTFTLPACKHEAVSFKPAVPKIALLSKDALIVVGEDNLGVRNVVVEALRSAGYRVIACNDGTSVLSAVAERSEEVTAVVLDVGLPGYTGVECLARLRTTLPMLPCVLTTGGARPSLSGDLVEHTAFLAKPFSIDDLLVTVDALVDIRRAGV